MFIRSIMRRMKYYDIRHASWRKSSLNALGLITRRHTLPYGCYNVPLTHQLVVFKKLNMQCVDVVTAYFYGDLDTKIYIKVPKRLKLTD